MFQFVQSIFDPDTTTTLLTNIYYIISFFISHNSCHWFQFHLEYSGVTYFLLVLTDLWSYRESVGHPSLSYKFS